MLSYNDIAMMDFKKGVGGFDKRVKTFFHHSYFVFIFYLLFITGAELLTIYNARSGIVFHAFILFALLTHSSLTKDNDLSGLLMVLTLAPLIRILSLSMPLAHFSYINQLAMISIPVYIAIFTSMYIQPLNPKDVALSLPRKEHLPIEIAVIILAVPLGILEYHILQPRAIIGLNFESLIVPSLIMILCTGFLEELAFRGLMQHHATRTMGIHGIVLVSALFGFMHIGNLSFLDVLLAFSIALIYSMVVRMTGSLFGVSVSHGTINIVLFLIAPHYF